MYDIGPYSLLIIYLEKTIYGRHNKIICRRLIIIRSSHMLLRHKSVNSIVIVITNFH